MILHHIISEKNDILFNETDQSIFVGEDLDIGCGVIGIYSSCHWENNNLRFEVVFYQPSSK